MSSKRQGLFLPDHGLGNLWDGMPEFVQEDVSPYDSVVVHFSRREDVERFYALLGYRAYKERPRGGKAYLWFPEGRMEKRSQRHVPGTVVPPGRHPIYVISKGRWKSRKTGRELDKLGLDYRMVVEPQEAEKYAAVMDEKKILVLPFSNLGQGSIPARNWVLDHAVASGAAKHWILDDNIQGWYRLNRNVKAKIVDENPFKWMEAWADRYENVAFAGPNYEFFVIRTGTYPPLNLNTRVYSCILFNHAAPYRWRGRYNEDTDLCLRALKDGWCTALFNAWLAKKVTTMTMAGGNTDELYAGGGRRLMAESLKEQHPDVVTVTHKWGRWQHQVDYRPFKGNRPEGRN